MHTLQQIKPYARLQRLVSYGLARGQRTATVGVMAEREG